MTQWNGADPSLPDPNKEAQAVKRGRPTLYTPEIAVEICERLATGESLRSVCRDDRYPHEATVRLWAMNDVDGFSTRYAIARDLGADAIADEIIEISDDGTNDWMDRQRPDGSTERVVDHEHVNRSRLRVDSRKWLLSKLVPKRYGDRTAVELSSPDGGPVQVEAVRSEISRRLDALAGSLPALAASVPALAAPDAPDGVLPPPDGGSPQ